MKFVKSESFKVLKLKENSYYSQTIGPSLIKNGKLIDACLYPHERASPLQADRLCKQIVLKGFKKNYPEAKIVTIKAFLKET